jgi:hypothetical protein
MQRPMTDLCRSPLDTKILSSHPTPDPRCELCDALVGIRVSRDEMSAHDHREHRIQRTFET